MSSLDSELNSDSSDDFSDEDRPVLAMLSSSSSEDEFDTILSVDSALSMSSSSHDVDIPLDARLERRGVRWQVHGSLLEDVFDTSVNHSLRWLNLPLYLQISNWMNEVRMAKVAFTICYSVLRRKRHLQGSLEGKALMRRTCACFLRFLSSRIVLHFVTCVLSSECLTIPCPLISCAQLWLYQGRVGNETIKRDKLIKSFTEA